MKIYQVDCYTEFYFKSIYKPWTYDALKLGTEILARNPVYLISGMGDPSKLEFASFLFTEERAQYFIDDVVRHSWTVPPELWSRWIAIRTLWERPGGKTNENWLKMIKVGQELWRYAAAKERQEFAARQFWEMVRSSATWKMIYDKSLEANQRYMPRGDASKFAADAADCFVKNALDKMAKIDELRNKSFYSEIMPYVERCLAWLGSWGGASLAAIGLAALGLACVFVLVWNPSEYGYRRAWYHGTRYILRYRDDVIWADAIMQTPKGKIVYANCLNIAGKVVAEEFYGKPPWEGMNYLYITPLIGPEQVDGLYYWIIWPWELRCRFVGMGRRVSAGRWVLQEGYESHELEPMYSWRDLYGVIQTQVCPWYHIVPPFGGQKDAKDWCAVPVFDWKYEKLKFRD